MNSVESTQTEGVVVVVGVATARTRQRCLSEPLLTVVGANQEPIELNHQAVDSKLYWSVSSR